MTYLQILNLIKDTALAQPNVNSVVREFLDLNREDAKYSAIVIQDRDGSRDRTEEQDSVTYTWHLGYVDRLTYDESNRDDIISTGINIINNIMNTIRNTWFPELEVSIVDRIYTFNQRFTAQCAGVYVVLAVNVQVSDCIDSESNDLYDKFEMTFTKNGHYHYVPSGRPIDEIDITIDCSESKKEELLKETIISNGSYSYDPKEGSVFNRVDITVDVHPSTSLSETYISNGSYNITGEFNGGVITVDVPAPQFVTETLNVSANGTYTPGQGVDGYSQVVVDVPIDGWDQKSVTEGTNIITNLDNYASFVASSAFQYNKNIQTVNLPYATTVNQDAFRECTSLLQVSLLICSRIESWAFRYCRSLSQVNLPMCSRIDYGVFQNCPSLSQVSLPMCSYIGNYAFLYCSSLSQLILPVCSYIGNNAFKDCHSLSQVSLPVCEYVGPYAFNVCESLSQLNLPMCSYIGMNAFEDCHSLSQVSLPMCSYIDTGVFGFCYSLSIITIGYSGVCSLYDNGVFYETQITSSTGSIYVPASLVASYKTADYWSYFKDRIFPIPS